MIRCMERELAEGIVGCGGGMQPQELRGQEGFPPQKKEKKADWGRLSIMPFLYVPPPNM